MQRLAILVALALPLCACKKSPEQEQAQAQADAKAQVDRICDAMNDLSLLYVAGLQDMEVESLDEPAGTREKLREVCKTLPLTVAQCADRLAIDDATCDEALEQHMGMTDSAPQGTGPTPRWVVETPFEAFDMAVSSDGQVALAGEPGLAVVADGEVRWSVELTGGATRVGWSRDCVLAGVGGELRCYDAEGKASWSTRVAKGEYGWLSAIEVGDEGSITVITDAGAIVRVDAAECAASSEDCATPVATVESLGGASIVLLSSGAILGSSDTRVTLVSATGTVLASRSADYDASVPSGELIVVGKEVLRANPSCSPSAEDCFTVVTTNEDIELVAPVELPEGVVIADTYGVIRMVGKSEWKIDAGNDADLFSDGATIYSVGHELGLGDALEAPPRLRAIDPRSGRTRWITTLGTQRASLLAAYLVELRAGSLVVATKTQLVSVPLE
ncbi:hypothetical protein [Paraliomyxa miuraensis]|uniref:hypothetical protein n=1 Tax=Paraliomyxa miuraensis TaxID=376150 RepID=UPI002259E652|nr:hypothetical protein [Paraliomyxa miuraensis]MCX4240618.1 hypothetical protein [Paraliomyxa miuraensis]